MAFKLDVVGMILPLAAVGAIGYLRLPTVQASWILLTLKFKPYYQPDCRPHQSQAQRPS